jgi:hypothetical protein
MNWYDINHQPVKNGDLIDLHQTVNGQNLFVVLNVSPLDIRYAHDLNYKYQYDMGELLKPSPYSGTVEYEIKTNIYTLINSVPK